MVIDFFNFILPTIEHFRFFGYWIILFLSLFEALAFVGLALPGTVLVILFGFIAAKGVLDIGDTIWFVAIGAILGDAISYYLGSNAEKFFSADSKIFKSKYLKRGESFFNKYGGRSILIGRFIGPMRPITPFVAGLFKLDKRKFFSWLVLSCFSWATIFLLLGFFFGQAWQVIVLWSTRAGIFVAGAVGLFVVFYVLKWAIIKNGRQALFFLASIWRSIQQAVVNNSEIRKLVTKHPAWFRFFRARLDRTKFSGLPLTFLLFSFIYVLGLFAGIITDIIKADAVVALDVRVDNLLAVFRNPGLTKLFFWVTLFGKWQVVAAFALAAAGALWLRKKSLYITPLFISIVGSNIFTWLSKLVFHRPRPEVGVYAEQSFSFPSGHATSAVAFYGFVAYLLLRGSKKWKTKVNLLFVAFIFILLIGFSRLYLGVHYLSDVWGGYLVGALWLIVSISISEWLIYRRSGKPAPVATKNSFAAAAGLISLAALFYVVFALNYNPLPLVKPAPAKAVVVDNIDEVFSNGRSKYTETVIGTSQEPLSFIIFANSDKDFLQIFSQAGWWPADKVTGRTVMKLLAAALWRQPYPQAPMTPSFWSSQVHNFGFEKPTTANNARQRHHARFWKTDYVNQAGQRMYVGTASLDKALKWGIAHKIDPNIDREREFLYKDLLATGLVSSWQKKKFVEANLGQNFSGDPFFTDGELYIITLK